MNSFNDGRQRFAKWIRDRREELNLTEDEFAERLDTVVAVVLMWEVGNTYWESLPRDTKLKIEELCGKYPSHDISMHQEFRQSTGTAFADDIEQDVKRIRAEGESNPSVGQGSCSNVGLNCKIDGVEDYCRCGTPLWISYEGQCPECKRRADPSQ